MLWLYLHFPALQLDSLFAEQHEQPVAIVDGRHHDIVQINNLAREAGLKVGMGLASAAALCHDIQVHQYNADIESIKLEEIAQWLYLKTSDITLYPPQGVLLRVTHMLNLYEGLERYWQHLSEHLNSLNIEYDYSFGYSMQQAQLLAQSQERIATSDKTTLDTRLKDLPIEAAGLHSHNRLETKTIEQLKRIGIKKIGDLLNIPIQELARKFDIQLVNYIGQLSGRFKTNVTFYHPPEHFSRYLELLYDIENVQWIEKPLGKLLVQLETFLMSRSLVGYELKVLLHQRDGAPTSFFITSAAGEYMAERWQKLSVLVMESIQIDSPVTGITLSVIRQGDFESHTHDFFEGKRDRVSQLELLSLLQAKLGKESIQKIVPTADPRPEKSNEFITIGDTSTQVSPLSNSVPSKLRPSFLFDEPKALEQKCSLIAGPERIVTGWWDDQSIMRDYFIAHNEEGQWLWVFRTPDRDWFLHGLFS